jgi:serine/threonine-protein kinase HipA
LRYPDGVHPELAPLYDPVCVTAFFEGVSEQDYAINRAIDKTVRAFTWDDLDALLEKAKVTRRSRALQLAKRVAAKAVADWPALLKGAPENMQRAISERLAGGVALATLAPTIAPAARKSLKEPERA